MKIELSEKWEYNDKVFTFYFYFSHFCKVNHTPKKKLICPLNYSCKWQSMNRKQKLKCAHTVLPYAKFKILHKLKLCIPHPHPIRMYKNHPMRPGWWDSWTSFKRLWISLLGSARRWCERSFFISWGEFLPLDNIKKIKIQWNLYKEFLWNKSAKVARLEKKNLRNDHI